jgi:hypothetical protein
MLTTTCMIVLFTTLVFGSTTPLMLKLLGIPTGVEEPDDEPDTDPGTGAKAALLHTFIRQEKLSGREEHHARQKPLNIDAALTSEAVYTEQKGKKMVV